MLNIQLLFIICIVFSAFIHSCEYSETFTSRKFKFTDTQYAIKSFLDALGTDFHVIKVNSLSKSGTIINIDAIVHNKVKFFTRNVEAKLKQNMGSNDYKVLNINYK